LMRDAKMSYSKDERRRPGFSDELVRYVLSIPAFRLKMESAVLVDETDCIDGGCRTYFPESPEMLGMLWRAKMDVALEDLDVPSFPRAFAVSWPRCSVEGAELVGCLVWWGTGDDRTASLERFGERYVGGPVKPLGKDGMDGGEMSMNVSMCTGDGVVCRTALPDRMMRECLRSSATFKDAVSSMMLSRAPGVVPLSDEEFLQHYVVLRLVVHLMVYVKACPGAVKDGYPDGRKDKEFWFPGVAALSPTCVGAPAHMGCGTHESPAAHWRTWHFRSYPARQGSRKAGVVFVRGTMVNADVDPKTVESVGKGV